MLVVDVRNLAPVISKIGADPQDSDEVRLQKALLVNASLMFLVAAIIWGIIYLLFGKWRAGLIPLSYALVSLLSILIFAWTRRYHFFRFSQLLLILLLPFFLMIALGGFVNSSAVILWSFFCPLGALLFYEPRSVPRWLLAYLGLLVLGGFLQPYVRQTNQLPPDLVIAFFVLNIGTVSGLTFILLNYFVGQKNLAFELLRLEQEKSERLLLNVLPSAIATRLKSGEHTIADYYESASILFADLSGFTPLSAELSPGEMVELLNEIYSHFDSLVEKYGVEKIRTIGDNYMIAAGLPEPKPGHAKVLASLALEMNAYLASGPPVRGKRLSFRIGINTGPVIAGVIGHKKFAYDVWGDAVNIASRMESQGEPGKIQITRSTYEQIQDGFDCEPRGSIPVKGKGLMETWYLSGPKSRDW